MSANGISHLATKAARKAAKLALAATKRATIGKAGYRSKHILDASLKSPTLGRPWK